MQLSTRAGCGKKAELAADVKKVRETEEKECGGPTSKDVVAGARGCFQPPRQLEVSTGDFSLVGRTVVELVKMLVEISTQVSSVSSSRVGDGRWWGVWWFWVEKKLRTSTKLTKFCSLLSGPAWGSGMTLLGARTATAKGETQPPTFVSPPHCLHLRGQGQASCHPKVPQGSSWCGHGR